MKEHIYTSLLKDEIEGFLKIRQSQGFKDRHRYVLSSLDNFLTSRNVTEKSLTVNVIDSWIATLKGKTAKTINVYVGFFNSFAKYLLLLGIKVFTPEYVRVRDSYVPYIFSESEICAIFAAADDINLHMQKNFITSRIQFAMLLRLLYGCGLRLSEALNLKKSDIDLTTGVLFIRGAKGNRDRFVPMDTSLTATLICYSNYLLNSKSEGIWLFEQDKDKSKPRSGSWTQYPFRNVLAKGRIDLLELPPGKRNICLHCLRHTFIVRSFRKQDLVGIDNYDPAASISVYVGHSNLTGTQRYVHMTAENSLDIINSTNEYSKQMFPIVLNAPEVIVENETPAISEPPEIEVNHCSTGMFPEVPR